MSNLDDLSEDNRKALEQLAPGSSYWTAAKTFLSETEDGQDLTERQFDWMMRILASLRVETNKGIGKEVFAEPSASKHTLTEMLVGRRTVHHSKEEQIEAVKDTFKDWLRTVGLPNYLSYGKGGVPISATESLRQLLITLLDEP